MTLQSPNRQITPQDRSMMVQAVKTTTDATGAGKQTWLEVHRPFLLLLARQWVGSLADAEDVVQESCVRFWKWGRQQAEDPRAYLATCVKRTALDFLEARERRKTREQSLTDGMEPGTPMFECPLEQHERRTALESALSQLPAEQREVLLLKIWGGLTFPQIGAITEVSANTASSRYRYALAALREKLPKW